MTDPRVRVGHCSPDAPNVDVHVDGSPAFENVAFRDVSDYAELPAGSHHVEVRPAAGGDPVITADLDLAEDTNYTVLATGALADIEPTVMEDDPGEVPSGKAHVRLIHASPDAPAVDVRVADGPRLFSGIDFRTASGYEQVDAGTYDIEVLPTGTDDIALSVDGIGFDGGTAYSAMAVGRAGDGSLEALLIEDAMPEMPAD